MRKQKRRSAMLKKIVVMFAAVVLIVAATISGTLAWLTAATDPVTNTFTVGNVDIDIKEVDWVSTSKELVKEYEESVTDYSSDWGERGSDGKVPESDIWVNSNEYKFVPGDTLPKKPAVRVDKGSEKCFLFISVEEKNNDINELDSNKSGKLVTWTVDTSIWTAVPEHDGYWYKVVETNSENDQFFDILTNDSVSVSSDITKGMVETINAKATQPGLSFKAAAIQFDNIEDSNNDGLAVDEAWDKLPADF